MILDSRRVLVGTVGTAGTYVPESDGKNTSRIQTLHHFDLACVIYWRSCVTACVGPRMLCSSHPTRTTRRCVGRSCHAQ